MSTSKIPDSIIEEFRNQMRGEVITPQDSNYDETRAVYNGMIDKRPALTAKCTDVTDVVTAVRFARENKLLVSVRGGGHNAASSTSRGLVSPCGDQCISMKPHGHSSAHFLHPVQFSSLNL